MQFFEEKKNSFCTVDSKWSYLERKQCLIIIIITQFIHSHLDKRVKLYYKTIKELRFLMANLGLHYIKIILKQSWNLFHLLSLFVFWWHLTRIDVRSLSVQNQAKVNGIYCRLSTFGRINFWTGWNFEAGTNMPVTFYKNLVSVKNHSNNFSLLYFNILSSLSR